MLHFQGLGGRHMADVFEEKLAEFMGIIVELYGDFSEKPGEFQVAWNSISDRWGGVRPAKAKSQ
jgi:hypothetical protein